MTTPKPMSEERNTRLWRVRRNEVSLLGRMLRRLSVGHDAGCWLWRGAINRGGYGSFKTRAKTYPAHRFFYETYFGDVPHGLELDHLCRVRHCVNPFHLEPVTKQENQRRGVRARLAPAKLEAS